MAIAKLVEFAEGLSGTGGTTTGVDTTGCDLLVVVDQHYVALGGTPSLSDSYGNTWVPRSGYAEAGGYATKLFYAVNPTVGAGHTFTTSGSNIFDSVYVLGVSGADTSAPFDQDAGNNTAGGTTLKPGTLTPAAAGALLVTAVSNRGSGPTVDAGYGTVQSVANSGGAYVGTGGACQIQGSPAAVDPTWTVSTGGCAATQAVFLAGSSPPPPPAVPQPPPVLSPPVSRRVRAVPY